MGAVAQALLNTPRTSVLREVLPTLLSDLQALADPVVLVLDDYHLITSAEIHEGMAFVLDYLPVTAHLVIATRTRPPFPLARLRVRGQLAEIRAEHLRFSGDEAAMLLNDLLRLGLSAQDVARLHERTEGWAAGLYLAALSLRGRTDASAFIEAFAGDDRQIVDYLGTEVLDGQPEAVRTFLLRTSVLERLCGPLCDAVTGTKGSARMLEEIERANLFLVPLDEQRRWYRYHHLFSDLLNHQLQRSDADLVPVLHRRACTWYQAQSCVPDAIFHATAGGDLDVAVELIARHWNAFLNQGRLETLARWLDDLPPARLRGDPRLCIARAWLLMDSGRLDEVAAWIEAAEDGIRGPGDDLFPETAMLHTVLQYKIGDIGQAGHAARRVLRLQHDKRSFPRTVASLILGITRYWYGDVNEANEVLTESAELARASNNDLAHAYTLGYLAMIYAEQGDLDRAERLGRTATTLSDEPGFSEHFAVMFGHLALALVHEQRGALTDAGVAIARGVALSRRGAGRIEIAYALVTHARIRHRLGDAAGAATGFLQARGFVNACPDCGILDGLAVRNERTLGVTPRRQRVFEGLSDREHDVLRLLATDLSRREIADTLYVSLNTVKTHARNLYHKLGASTRAEAVARARELDLL